MMQISSRAAMVRNLAVAFGNGLVTLIILLIAPMGLLAVIVNTGLVAASTFVIATTVDRIVIFLLGSKTTEVFVESSRAKTIPPTHQLEKLDSEQH